MEKDLVKPSLARPGQIGSTGWTVDCSFKFVFFAEICFETFERGSHDQSPVDENRADLRLSNYAG